MHIYLPQGKSLLKLYICSCYNQSHLILNVRNLLSILSLLFVALHNKRNIPNEKYDKCTFLFIPTRYQTFWVNRAGAPMEELDVMPNAQGRSLEDVLKHVQELDL